MRKNRRYSKKRRKNYRNVNEILPVGEVTTKPVDINTSITKTRSTKLTKK